MPTPFCCSGMKANTPEDQGRADQHDCDVDQETRPLAEEALQGGEERDAEEEQGIAQEVDEVDGGREWGSPQVNL